MPRVYSTARLAHILVSGLVLCALAAPPAAGQEYQLDLPAYQLIAYRIELELVEPGKLVIETDWIAGRVLSFRLERPGRPPLRRSGPSPIRIELEVEPEDLRSPEPWVLSLRGLPSRLGGPGTMRITLPREQPDPEEIVEVVEPVGPGPDPWTLPRATPGGLSAEQIALYEAMERFRAMLVDHGPTQDSCGWQMAFLRDLTETRDSLGTPEAELEETTADTLRRLVEVVEQIDELRRSDDPLLAGPEPRDATHRRAWLMVRKQQLRPLRRGLDDLIDAMHRGYAPELELAGWPAPFLSCLTACERHYEESGRMGSRAPYGELAADQWPQMMAAAEVVDALLSATGRPRD